MHLCAHPQRGLQRLARAPLALLLGLVALGAAPPSARCDDAAEALARLGAELRVTGMTFVGSRGDVDEFVLRAERGVFRPESNLAVLEEVRVTAADSDEGDHFEVSCERGEFNVETNDFFAEGDVHGVTGDDRRYTAPWVRYHHEKALLYTDAPVLLQDATGNFRGDGFRYHLKDRRFRLVGNVSVVQTP
jgi:LPS export ABC transporter protein LptC